MSGKVGAYCRAAGNLACLTVCCVVSACSSGGYRPPSPAEFDQEVRPLMRSVNDWMNTIEGAECEIVTSADQSLQLIVTCNTTDRFRMCLPRTARGCVQGIREIQFTFSGYLRSAGSYAMISGDFRPRVLDNAAGVLLVFERLPNGEWRLEDADWSVVTLASGQTDAGFRPIGGR